MLRFGIIGAGGIAAKSHLPELAALGDRAQVTLIAGRTASPARRRAMKT
jgi:predicted dehydrogenase